MLLFVGKNTGISYEPLLCSDSVCPRAFSSLYVATACPRQPGVALQDDVFPVLGTPLSQRTIFLTAKQG